ncbi:uncharacterized protein LOC129959180 [Argiope bruennichi]|uniref:uncharacterized protein LOC129959180 n=1 Tax=Argiope bruennichi TaxID=94029 RepID=UPI00249523CC|nr:uncharacterized protein LOC129959180 [Argiope bruennichi]
MGDLRRDQIIPSRPFYKVGIDLEGPIIAIPNLKRSRVTIKSYIAIFICFSTKATHLEIISDLTTETFLACFERFIARRSRPSVIWSDNATNFKGAYALLNPLFKLCKSNSIQRFSAEEGFNWNFIPPAAPNFGGLWEVESSPGPSIQVLRPLESEVSATTTAEAEMEEFTAQLERR